MKTRSTLDFEGVVVVSPQQQGEGDKNQDRAVWWPTLSVGCVCDGVSSSPYSAEAAEIGTLISPALFQDQAEESLRTLSTLLLARRREVQGLDVSLPDQTPTAMRPHLREAVLRRRKQAFQTTLAAARVERSKDMTVVDHLVCGDSAFFAFSPQGQTLFDSRTPRATNAEHGDLLFGPSHELLVKVVGSALDRPELARQAEIRPTHASSWLICQPLDQCDVREEHRTRGDLPAVRLTRDDCLLVPRFILGASRSEPYRRLRYSSCIRMSAAARRPVPKGSVTAVLPDHVATDCHVQHADMFPADTRFALTTDGFYECFSDSDALGAWLIAHDDALSDSDACARLLSELHVALDRTRGDDDMSLVWIRPRGRSLSKEG